MSSSPGQGKECLPPKKRESRQGSAEQGPTDTFKRPAPPWERAGGRRAEHRAEAGEEPLMNSCYGVDVLPPMTPPMTPPLPSASPQTQPLPAPTPMYSLPWHLPYPVTMATPFISSDASLVWRGQSASGGDTLELSWSRPLALQHAGVHIPYRAQFPTDPTGDLFTCLPPRQRNYSSAHSQIAHTQLFSRPPAYSREPLHHDKTGLPTRRPNGFDRRDSWHPHAGKSLDRQGNGRRGWETQDGPRCEGKRSCHEYRQSPTQAFSEDTKNTPPLLQGKDLWATPRAPPAKPSDTRGTLYDFPVPPGPPGPAGPVHYALPPLSCTVPQQHPLEHPCLTPPTLRNTELSLLGEKRHVEVPRSQTEGPNGNHPRQDHQRSSCPSPRGHGSKARAGAPLNPANPSSPKPGPPRVLPYFRKGSLIELCGGRLKRVEELQTEDFLSCPDPGPDIHLSSCTILMISPSPDPAFSRLQVLLPDHSTQQELLEVLVEYPFFVRDRGWSSCCPRRTVQLYELRCHQLRVGDVCLALTPSPLPPHPPSPSPPALPVHAGKGRGRGGEAGSKHRNAHSKAGEEKLALPSPPPAPLRESPRKRKRRWSAPELQGGSRTPAELPHSPKHRGQQWPTPLPPP
ncbi:ataxin-1-like isoform X1 [Anguilla rostrata]|uniref:ataxin-1-like isoform X1 n=1 Tax=Anguilla rostrata TaxID=7938 RepID=UPI0030CAA248